MSIITKSPLKISMPKSTPKKYAVVFAIALVIAILSELFIFNFKWLNSAFDKKIDILPSFTNATPKGDTVKFNSDNAAIEFKNINSKIKYLKFSPQGENLVAEITVSAVDEANARSLSAPTRKICSGVAASQYIRLHFSGEVSSLKISVKGMNGKSMRASDIVLNTKVPLLFSWLRLLIFTCMLMLGYVLRPSSEVYKIKTNLHNGYQQCVVFVLLIMQAAMMWNMIHWNTGALYWNTDMESHKQYYEFADAVKNGHFYLDDEVSDSLLEMENPYDTQLRAANKVKFQWDHAYYNGKYYMYFGALPTFLLYLPYNLMTGKDLPNYIAAYIFSLAIMIGILLLLWEVIKKWFKNTPFVIYLLISVVFGACSIFAYTIYKPDLYIIPIISALMFSVFGLAFWISAATDNKPFVKWKLAVGSLCIAATSACRPQFLLSALFGVMLFWDDVFKQRRLFSKNSIKPTTAVCLPFVIFGMLVMWYNFARFGSPFDFGANYNLTSNDMTHRGIVFGRCGLGIFTYFLQTPHICAVFPFIQEFRQDTVYQGLTLSEMLEGGVLWLYPILFISVFGMIRKSLFKDKKCYLLVYLSVIMAVIIAVADTQMAGLLTRYFSDFVWLMMLASSVTIFALIEKYKDTNMLKHVLTVVLTLSALTLSVSFLIILAHTENSIVSSNPLVFYKIQHLIAFWM